MIGAETCSVKPSLDVPGQRTVGWRGASATELCRGVVAVACLAWAAAAGGQESPVPAGRTHVFSDDFSRDSREEYKTRGAVAWEAGRLTLVAGAGITTRIEPGQFVDTEIDLEPADLTGGSGDGELEVRLDLDSSERLSVLLTWRTVEGKPCFDLRLAAQFTTDTPLRELGRSRGLRDLSLRPFQLSYHAGLLRAGPDRCAVTAPDGDGTAQVTRLSLRTGAGTAAVCRLRVSSTALDEEQAAQLREARRLGAEVCQLWSTGKSAQALPLAERALEIRRQLLGLNHPATVLSLYNLGAQLRDAGDFATAKPLFSQVVEIHRSIFGEEHPEYALRLNSLAMLYHAMGQAEKAEPLQRQVLEIQKKTLGDQHPEYAKSLRYLAAVYQSLGLWDKAELLLRQALGILKKTSGEQHPDYAACLHSLAFLHHTLGSLGNAEALYRQALTIRRQTLGENHPESRQNLSNLAVLYESMGAPEKAEPLLRQALAILQQTVGEQHPEYADCLYNLASVYRSIGADAEAESLFRKSLEIQDRTVGDRDRDYAISLKGLGALYYSQGSYAKAEPLLRQALAIQKNTVGEHHPDYASSLKDVAWICYATGASAEAVALHRQALEVFQSSEGEQHLDCAESLRELGALQFYLGDLATAEALFRQSLELRLAHASAVGCWLPEAAARQFVEKIGVWPNELLSAMRHRTGSDPRAAYESIWQTAAVVTRMISGRGRLLVDTPAARQPFEELQTVSQQLAQVTLSAAAPEQREVRLRKLQELNHRKESLEARLAEISIEYGRQAKVEDSTAEDLTALLPPDAAVVHLVYLDQWDPPANGKQPPIAAHYEAFVLRPDDQLPGNTVAWVHLGLGEPINEAAAAWRAAFGGQSPAFPPSEKPPETVLRHAIWEKIEPHLAGCSKIVIIPDGELCFLPWNALPGRSPGTCLIEDYAISTAPYGQQLYAALTDQSSQQQGTLLVGGVAYDEPPSAANHELSGTAASHIRAPAMERRSRWPFLPGSLAEVQGIAALGEQAQRRPTVLSGAAASEPRLRSALPGHQAIHLATHGFFADEAFRVWAGHDLAGEQLIAPDRGLLSAGRVRVTRYHPMILSGIVLAGANLPPQTDDVGLPIGDDGVLTAEEIVGLDLRGTDLVVLSACDTGRGRVAGNEGVMGLSRAFQMAGARTVVASLWKVDDTATQELMSRFYRNLWERKLGKLESLRQAQLSLLDERPANATAADSATPRGPDFSRTEKIVPHDPSAQPYPRGDPRKWAAFFLSGAP